MGNMVAAEYVTLDGVTQDPGAAGEFEHRGALTLADAKASSC